MSRHAVASKFKSIVAAYLKSYFGVKFSKKTERHSRLRALKIS
jgi:hypothetical protein